MVEYHPARSMNGNRFTEGDETWYSVEYEPHKTKQASVFHWIYHMVWALPYLRWEWKNASNSSQFQATFPGLPKSLAAALLKCSALGNPGLEEDMRYPWHRWSRFWRIRDPGFQRRNHQAQAMIFLSFHTHRRSFHKSLPWTMSRHLKNRLLFMLLNLL